LIPTHPKSDPKFEEFWKTHVRGFHYIDHMSVGRKGGNGGRDIRLKATFFIAEI
jgi:hypothetical protein